MALAAHELVTADVVDACPRTVAQPQVSQERSRTFSEHTDSIPPQAVTTLSLGVFSGPQLRAL